LLLSPRYNQFIGIVLIGISLLLPHGASFADTLPVPQGQEVFSYFPVASPVVGATPSETKPIGIRPYAEGGRTLSVQISLSGFSGNVDVFFGLYAPAIGLDRFYLLAGNGNLRALSDGLVAWKSGAAMIDAELFGPIDTSLLPRGRIPFTCSLPLKAQLNSTTCGRPMQRSRG
jgi:hypothetical protein